MAGQHNPYDRGQWDGGGHLHLVIARAPWVALVLEWMIMGRPRIGEDMQRAFSSHRKRSHESEISQVSIGVCEVCGCVGRKCAALHFALQEVLTAFQNPIAIYGNLYAAVGTFVDVLRTERCSTPSSGFPCCSPPSRYARK